MFLVAAFAIFIMLQPPISCPVVRVPAVVPCAASELDELVAFLQSDAPIEEVRAFARGTLLPDGRLDLCKQSVGAAGCARIVAALRNNSRVKSVLLGTDAIGDEGAFAVAELIENNPNLEVVYLGCNNISARGTTEIARVLADNSSVRGLWLKRNPIGDDGLTALAQMLKRNAHLQILDIVNCGFSATAFAVLGEVLHDDNRALTRLYAGGNGLSARDATALSEILRRNDFLEGLYLNVGALGDEGAQNLAQGLKTNRNLRQLGLGSNDIGLTGLRALTEHSGQLETLDLGRAASQTALGASGNDFAGGGELCAALLHNPRLQRLNLRGTRLKNDDFSPIFWAAARHPTLCELQLDAPLPAEVKANLAQNRAATSQPQIAGIELIKSVYRTV